MCFCSKRELLIPCNCSENCPQRYSLGKLLKAEMENKEIIQCHESYESVSISSLLDGYKGREDRMAEYNEILRKNGLNVTFNTNNSQTNSQTISQTVETRADASPTLEAKLDANVNVNINIDLKVYLPQIQTDFDNLRREIKNSEPELKEEMDEIQDRLDEVCSDDNKDKLKKPFNKLYRLLDKMSDPTSAGS